MLTSADGNIQKITNRDHSLAEATQLLVANAELGQRGGITGIIAGRSRWCCGRTSTACYAVFSAGGGSADASGGEARSSLAVMSAAARSGSTPWCVGVAPQRDNVLRGELANDGISG